MAKPTKEQSKKYREKNKAKIAEGMKKYYQANKTKFVPKDKEVANQRALDFYHENKDRILNDRKIRIKTDPLYRTKEAIRKSVYESFKKGGYKKNTKTERIIGCTFAQFKEYLESKFEDWMNWSNKGLYKKGTYNYGWDIDHIIPIDTAETIEDIIRLNHYTNLQPLCSKVNRDIKRANYEVKNAPMVETIGGLN